MRISNKLTWGAARLKALLRGFHDAEEGLVLAEFVILLPLLCLLLFLILFFQHIQDYQHDAHARFRFLAWEMTLPSMFPKNKDNSDYGFIHGPVQSSPGVARQVNAIALERFMETPYLRLSLPIDNQFDGVFNDKPCPPNPWGVNLAAFAQYFKGRVPWSAPGGLPESHDDAWSEHFPKLVDPWQRDFHAFKELAIFSNSGAASFGEALMAFSIQEMPLIKADGSLDCDTWENPLAPAERGQIRNAVQ